MGKMTEPIPIRLEQVDELGSVGVMAIGLMVWFQGAAVIINIQRQRTIGIIRTDNTETEKCEKAQ